MSSHFSPIGWPGAAAACRPLQPVEASGGDCDEMARLMAQMQELRTPSWLEMRGDTDEADDMDDMKDGDSGG
ncbi:hypothetical protein GT347_19630 [Xylophilus rhododendri]|uniref:Uncharacterized protein n=1 Tax=Xylophilus rhododendri TaxID=2697032 RepID=A0A857J802_9BURK|nr:hypothetical protein [Xylophilus rhododendri]QHI99996.1 hypothetical protein GT347_19630 [Xylophilus rhododendri]